MSARHILALGKWLSFWGRMGDAGGEPLLPVTTQNGYSRFRMGTLDTWASGKCLLFWAGS
jgi:hypothetical protein